MPSKYALAALTQLSASGAGPFAFGQTVMWTGIGLLPMRTFAAFVAQPAASFAFLNAAALYLWFRVRPFGQSTLAGNGRAITHHLRKGWGWHGD